MKHKEWMDDILFRMYLLKEAYNKAFYEEDAEKKCSLHKEWIVLEQRMWTFDHTKYYGSFSEEYIVNLVAERIMLLDRGEL